jgi:hypothetical protein
VIDAFGFETQITRLDEANLLYLVLGQFAEIHLHPEAVPNIEMGYLYEELIRRFSELGTRTSSGWHRRRRSAGVGRRGRTGAWSRCATSVGYRRVRLPP